MHPRPNLNPGKVLSFATPAVLTPSTVHSNATGLARKVECSLQGPASLALRCPSIRSSMRSRWIWRLQPTRHESKDVSGFLVLLLLLLRRRPPRLQEQVRVLILVLLRQWQRRRTTSKTTAASSPSCNPENQDSSSNSLIFQSYDVQTRNNLHPTACSFKNTSCEERGCSS